MAAVDSESKANLVYTVIAATTFIAAGFLVIKFIGVPSFVTAPIGAMTSIPDVFVAVGGFLWDHVIWVVVGFVVLVASIGDELEGS